VKRLPGRKTVVEQLTWKAHGLTVGVVDTKAEPKHLDLNLQPAAPSYEAA